MPEARKASASQQPTNQTGGQISLNTALNFGEPMEPLEKPFQPKGRSKLSLVHKKASRDQTKKIRKQTLPAMRVAYWGSRHRDDDKRESEDDTTKSGNIDLMAARLMGMSRMSRQQIENILKAGEILMQST